VLTHFEIDETDQQDFLRRHDIGNERVASNKHSFSDGHTVGGIQRLGGVLELFDAFFCSMVLLLLTVFVGVLVFYCFRFLVAVPCKA
jgi:hypothetical protein